MSARTTGSLVLLMGLLSIAALPAAAESRPGRIVGTVSDPGGVPQMGATVVVVPQSLLAMDPIQLLTDAGGHFATAALQPGLYSVRVTLAGFLPTLQPNVTVSSRHITSLEIELGSVFTGLSSLRRTRNERLDDSEWGWVLRASAATRPVLRWKNSDLILDTEERSNGEDNPHNREPRSRVDLMSGMRPGSATSFADSPATSFAYNQGIGATGQLLLAGQVSYQTESPSGGFATVWRPDGNDRSGPVTTLAIRQSHLGPEGPILRGMRLDQSGVIPLNDSVTLRYGAEYLLAGLGGATTAGLRPRAEVAVQIAPGWQASLLFASRPWPEASPEATAPLQSALESLDAFPTMLFRGGRPVLESGWHEELAVEHLFNKHKRILVAGFRDRSSNTAVFGRGSVMANPDFLQDFFSNGFAYDAGSSGSWGLRAAYQQKFSKDLSTTVVYAWAGALTPISNSASAPNLRDALATNYVHSLAGSVSSRIPRLGTQLTTGYKWIPSPVVSRQDEFGEATFGVDPYLNLVVRQPIPCGFLHHMQALADFGNLLGQGYVPVTTRDGRVVMVAAYRTVRGGLSLEF